LSESHGPVIFFIFYVSAEDLLQCLEKSNQVSDEEFIGENII